MHRSSQTDTEMAPGNAPDDVLIKVSTEGRTQYLMLLLMLI